MRQLIIVKWVFAVFFRPFFQKKSGFFVDEEEKFDSVGRS
jgi:hypothetical protein